MIGMFSGLSSPQAFWSMLNQYQLFLTLPLLPAYIPPKVLFFISEFDFFSFNFGFLNKIFPSMFSIEMPQSIRGLEVLGYSSQSFFVSFLNSGRTFLIVVTIHLLLLPFMKWKALQKGKFLKWLFPFLRRTFHFSIYIRGFFEIYLFSLISSAAEVVETGSNIKYMWSFLSALSYSGVALIVGLLIPIHYTIYHKKLNVLSNGLFKELYEGIKKKRALQAINMFFYILRRVLMSLIIIVLRTAPYHL